MKRTILMLLLFAPLALFAQKFGHVDSQSIIQSLPDYSRAMGELEAKGKELENELQASQAELQRLMEDYNKKKDTMNATQQQETENSLNEKFQRFQQQQQQSQQDFEKARADKLQPIITKVSQAIETVAKAGGYVYVMDIATLGNAMYINDTISKDLTAEVKAQLTKMK